MCKFVFVHRNDELCTFILLPSIQHNFLVSFIQRAIDFMNRWLFDWANEYPDKKDYVNCTYMCNFIRISDDRCDQYCFKYKSIQESLSFRTIATIYFALECCINSYVPLQTKYCISLHQNIHEFFNSYNDILLVYSDRNQLISFFFFAQKNS